MGHLATSDKDLLRRFERQAHEALPGVIVRVAPFGSRARGDHGVNSDFDVAVFVRETPPSVQTRRTLAAIASDLCVETGVFIQALALSEGRWQQRGLLVDAIKRDSAQA